MYKTFTVIIFLLCLHCIFFVKKYEFFSDTQDTIIRNISDLYNGTNFTVENANITNKITSKDAEINNLSVNSLNILPKGIIVAWTNKTAPKGWALCNGLNGTPDLRKRFIYGYGHGNEINQTGGSEKHTLTINEIPSHNHSYSRAIALSDDIRATANTRRDRHGGFDIQKTENAGGNMPHNNMPPYHVLAYIMKL